MLALDYIMDSKEKSGPPENPHQEVSKKASQNTNQNGVAGYQESPQIIKTLTKTES